MKIKNYVKPASLEEAYTLLQASKKNRLLAGCTFLRMTDIYINTGIDILDLGLDYICEEEDCIRIGAATPLRKMECNEALHTCSDGAFADILQHLIGVQLRNSITIGAHVFCRYGFSEIITLLLAMDASVRLYHGAEMRLEDFLQAPRTRDILLEIIIPLVKGRRTLVRSVRNSYSDYAILGIALTRSANGWRIAVGARPQRAACAKAAMEYLNTKSFVEGDEIKAAALAAQELTFGSNLRASAGYRRTVCRNLLEKMIGEAGICK